MSGTQVHIRNKLDARRAASKVRRMPTDPSGNPARTSAADVPLTILIADDDPDILVSGKYLFEDEGWKVIAVRSPKAALEQIEHSECDVALIDMNYNRNTTGGQEGLDLIAQIRKADADLPIVVMTAWGTIDLAIKTLKGGANDFVQKPWTTRTSSSNYALRAWQAGRFAATACLRRRITFCASNLRRRA